MTQSPQLKETIADSTTDVWLHCQLIVKVDAEISYNRDRLDDVITVCQVSKRQLAQVSSTDEPLQLRFQHIQLEST